MRIVNYLNTTIFSLGMMWLILFIFATFNLDSSYNISKIASSISIIINIFLTCITCHLFIKLKNKEMAFLFFTNLFLLINDIIFHYIAYIQVIYISKSSSLVGMDIFSHIAWNICLFAFIYYTFIRNLIKDNRKVSSLGSVFLLLSIIIITYLPSLNYGFNVLPTWGLLHKISFIIELILLESVILFLLYSENSNISMLTSGFIILIASDSITTYSYVAHVNLMESYGELFWLFGLLLILSGTILFKKEGIYENKIVIRRINAIRSKLSFWALSMSTSFVLLLYATLLFFMQKNSEIFIILPPFLIITIAFIIIISLITGRKFEKPFKKIADNINAIMHDADKNKVDHAFDIDEFVFLQKFIFEAYELKEERDYAKKALGELSAQVAHDIRSPIAAILMLIKDNSQFPDGTRVVLRDAAHRIQDIANNLLYESVKNKPSVNSDGDVSFIVSTAILSVISEKKAEYKNKPINISHEFFEDSVFMCVHANLMEFKRVLSNLINNAVESIAKEGKINVRLSATETSLRIDIIDSGAGMPSHLINNVMSGQLVSNKSLGLGLGLSHARTFARISNATFDIFSKNLEGTTVSLNFNKQSLPNDWVVSQICFTPNTTIVILDDDTSIHGAWDNLLSGFFKKTNQYLPVKHYTCASDCLSYIKSLTQSQHDNLYLLADYELIKQEINGLEVIELSNVKRAILVTSHYEDIEVIKIAIKLNTKILPKPLIFYTKLLLMSNPTVHEKVAKFVIVDDDSKFSEILYYLCEQREKVVDIYHDPYGLMNNLDRYDKIDTIFCLDFEINNLINGIELAEILYKRGFCNLYLASGYSFQPDEVPYYLRVLNSKMDLLDL